MKVGRPKGSIKDLNRFKIMNPNWRKIDVDGVWYNRYIRQGYFTDCTRLILQENVVPKVLKLGRPKASKNKILNVKIQNIDEKVQNPDAKRIIIPVNVIFKRLSFATDVKPSNILVNSRGEIKICDFGVQILPFFIKIIILL